MLRFIMKRKTKDGISGYEGEHFFTIDGDVVKVEEYLKKGGYGEGCYEIYELVGVEIIYKNTEGNNV